MFYYEAIVIKIMRHWHWNRSMTSNRIQKQTICINRNAIYDKGDISK